VQKPVPTTRQSLDISRRFSRVPQSFTQPLDGIVDAVVEVNKRVGGPYPPLKFLTRGNFTELLQQDLQNLKWLFLQPDLGPVAAQFSSVLI
jgi:hypothetical protein